MILLYTIFLIIARNILYKFLMNWRVRRDLNPQLTAFTEQCVYQFHHWPHMVSEEGVAPPMFHSAGFTDRCHATDSSLSPK